MKQVICATVVLMTTIVGVGMFGLPYAGIQSGFMVAAIFLLILTIVMAILHLFYGEIVVKTKEKHRLVGYIDHYLGKKWKLLVSLSVIIGFYGSLLVYIVVGGQFLADVFSFTGLSSVVFYLIFFAIGSLAIYFGIKLITGLDILMGIFLFLIVFSFLLFGINHINIDNFKGVNLSKVFFPYGAILYSLAGMAAIPEIRDIFKKGVKGFKRAIIWGTVIPAVMYFVFIFTVIGLTGEETSLNAISGLSGILGNKIILLGAVFGFLATITSFFVIGLSLKKTFHFDFKINKQLSWVLVCFVPLILLMLGVNNFVSIIVILGALMGGIEGVAVILAHNKIKKEETEKGEYSVNNFYFVKLIMIIMFVAGFVYTLISALK